MRKNPVLVNKTLVFTIIILLFGTGIVTSANHLIRNAHANHQSLESFNNQKNLLACDHLAYVGGSGEFCCLYEFTLNDPVNLTCIWPECGGGHLNGGNTWTNDGRWLACEYNTGSLWEIDLETGDMENIGGGGTGCHSLAWDPVENRLYATSGNALYEYNPDTGEQYYIGSHSVSNTMIGLAINSEGECYAWDVTFSSNPKFFTVDLETGEADEIGTFGMHIYLSRDGDFCKKDDILYLPAYNESVSYLFAWDLDTGPGELVGQFQEDVYVTTFVIPWNYPPDKPIIDGPISGKPNTEYDFTFVSTDPDGDAVMYNINWGDGDTEWTEYGDSGLEFTLKHTWEESGKYTIKAQAVDIHSAESDWSNFTVTMPRDKVINDPILNWFQSHPNKFSTLQKIIQHLGL